MKILITTDLEGVSGIVDWDAHQRGTQVDVWQRKLMTNEVNAAIAAAFDAGADFVKVAEGHDAIDFWELDHRAVLVPARWPAIPCHQGWDDGFDALIQIGRHAMEGTPNAVLAHSYSHKTIESVFLNDIQVGEIGVEAAEAGDFGFPTIMVSGDEAACEEARNLLGDVEVAPVKIGFGCHHAACLHPQKASALIYEKVTVALRRLDTFTPFVIPGRIAFAETTQSPRDPEALSRLKARPQVEIKNDRTVIYHGQNVVEAMARRCGFDPAGQ